MSGTIVLSWSLTHTNGAQSLPVQNESTTSEQFEQGVVLGTPTILTTGTVIDLVDDITELGIAWFKNLDDTNFVDIGTFVDSAFRPFGRLLAGERYPIRLTPGIVLYAQANGENLKLQVSIYEA